MSSGQWRAHARCIQLLSGHGLRTRGRGAALAVVGLIAACGGDDTGGAGAAGIGAGNAGGAAGSAGRNTASGSCEAPRLFPPRALGESGREVISTIEYDADAGDIYYSTGVELYVLRADGDEPTLLSTRPTDISGEFWLLEDRILVPSGFQIPLVDTEVAVLYSMPREGGEPEVQVSVPVSDEFGWSYEIGSVEVQGDDVVWIGRDRFNDTSMVLGGETTYFVRKTSWRTPGAPEELYRSQQRLTGLIVAGDYAFVTEELEEENPLTSTKQTQRIIDLGSGEVLAMASEQRYGGFVVAGDEDSLLVTRTNPSDLPSFGTWHMSPDGTNEIKLGDVLLLAIFGPATAVSRDGRWAFTNVTPDNDMDVFTFTREDGLCNIGCFDANASTAGIEIAGDRVVLSTFENDESSLIAFDL